MASPEVILFSCTICDELLGDYTYTTQCGHIFHYNCIKEWLKRSISKTCPNCRDPVINIMKLFPSDNERFTVKPKEELDALHFQLNSIGESNVMYEYKVNELTSKLNTMEDSLKQSNTSYLNLLNSYNQTIINQKKHENVELKFNDELSKRLLLQKEFYEYQSKNSAELKKLKSELEKLKSEKEHFQSKYHSRKKPNTSSKNARSKNALPRQIQSPELQPTTGGVLSNCHFLIVDELRNVMGATNHIRFYEQDVKENGGTVAFSYTNMVTHVICSSQQNLEVITGLKNGKKCVTEFWLSDVIREQKIKKPWLPHHFPIPYSEDNLPYENKYIAIVNFDKNEYHKIKAMVEITGATVINKIMRSTYIVISMKLEGEIIKKALYYNIPVVNIKWIHDILFGAKIVLENYKRKKYQKYELPNPYKMNYRKVLHLMEAWKKPAS